MRASRRSGQQQRQALILCVLALPFLVAMYILIAVVIARPASHGRQLRIDLIDIVRVDGGRIVEHWAVIDQLGLMRQLGALQG